MKQGVKEYIEQIYPGKWVGPKQDQLADLEIDNVTYQLQQLISQHNVFIAMKPETFNTKAHSWGPYSAKYDSHETVLRYLDKVSLLIVEYELPDVDVPQYMVENSYDFLLAMAKVGRERFEGKIISITGTVGKSTTKELLSIALESKTKVYYAHENYNSRTAVRCMLASLLPESGYEYAIFETSLAALWFGESGVTSEVKGHYSIFTQFGIGQKGTTARDAIDYKSRMALNMSPGGKVILNRDADEYDYAYETISEKNDDITTFSRTQAADGQLKDIQIKDRNHSILTFTIHGKSYDFVIETINQYDQGFVSNLIGVLTLLATLGFDLADFHETFLAFTRREHLLNFMETEILGHKVTLLDDTYSAEELSTQNSIKLVNQIADQYSGKTYAIFGLIYNIGDWEHHVYDNMVKSVEAGAFDKVFTFGDRIDYLQEQLPERLKGGHFRSLAEMQKYLLPQLDEDSLVLLKGDTRETNLRTVIELFKEPTKNYAQNASYGLATAEKIDVFQADELQLTEGVANILLYHETLQRLNAGLIHLDDIVTFDDYTAEPNATRSTGAKPKEKRYLKDILSQAVSLNAPDALLALALFLYYNDPKLALHQLQAKAERYGIDPASVRNLTARMAGRRQQKLSLTDIGKAAQLMTTLPAESLRLLKNRPWLIDGREFAALNYHDQTNPETVSIIWGSKNRIGIVLDLKETVTAGFGVNLTEPFELIDTLEYTATNGSWFEPEKLVAPTKLTEPFVNVLGDTYFGEFYSERRKNKGRTDALLEHGYGYSFEKLASLLPADHYNVVNLETALPADFQAESPYHGMKTFVLGGKADETLTELSNRHINLVALGNNHTYDYGQVGVRQTLEKIRQHQLEHVGAGTSYEALRPARIQYKEQTIAIFNGYWYGQRFEKRLNAFAVGDYEGVACLNGMLLNAIKTYRAHYPEHEIWCVCHWGKDYEATHEFQKQTAHALVTAGCDLVMGCGAHFIQPVTNVLGKKVFFSLGNGVFNSDGEYGPRKLPPYSLAVRVDLETKKLRVYPLYVDNLATDWQPRGITEDQIPDLLQADLGKMLQDQPLKLDKTKHYYFELDY